MGIITAQCRYCGQIAQVETDKELTKKELEEEATMMCNCTQAKMYKREIARKERALKNVTLLFDTHSSNIVRILELAVEEICEGNVNKITLQLQDSVKACISQTAKGEINVEKTETRKQKLM